MADMTAPREPLEPPQFRYCPVCGTALHKDPTSRRPVCPGCGFIQYLNPIAVVAGVLLSASGDLPAPGEFVQPEAATHVLLVRRTSTYAGQWCIPCGYLEYDEDIQTAAAREMREETGLDVEVREPFAVLSNFHRPLEQSVGTWFLVRRLSGHLRAGDDADRAALLPLDAIPVPLAFPTDREVIRMLRARATDGL